MAKPSEALIRINEDGSARQLTAAEKRYVDTEFSPFDGARPYIKATYEHRNGWGEIAGFLHRDKLPADVAIQPVSDNRSDRWEEPLVRGTLRFQLHHAGTAAKLRLVLRRFLLWRRRLMVRQMKFAARRLGIPTLPPPRTMRQALLRAVTFWATLAVFFAAYRLVFRSH